MLVSKKLTKLTIFGLSLFIGLVFIFGLNIISTAAAPNLQMNYQGKLSDLDNDPVPDGTYQMEFSLCDSLESGTCIWTESHTSTPVQIRNGLFSVMLGAITPLTSVSFNQILYLEVKVGTSSLETLAPRKILGSVPSAFEAQRLSGLSSSSFLRSDITNTVALFDAASSTNFFANVFNALTAVIDNLTASIANLTSLVFGNATGTQMVVGNLQATSTATLASTTITGQLTLGSLNGLLNATGGVVSTISTSSLGINSSQWITSGSDIYYSAGNVAIGTTTLTARLTVDGDIWGGLNSRFGAGDNYWQFEEIADLDGVTHPQLVAYSDGASGIGAVKDSLAVVGYNPTINFSSDSDFSSTSGLQITYYSGSDDSLKIFDSRSGEVLDKFEVMAQTTNLWGFSTSTTSPILDNFNLINYKTADWQIGDGVGMVFNASVQGGALPAVIAAGKIAGVITDGITSTTAQGALAFYTYDGSTSSERMRLDGQGNLGIGTTIPAVKLEVLGRVSSTDIYSGMITLDSNKEKVSGIDVGDGPAGVGVKGNYVFVANSNDGTLSVIDKSDPTNLNTVTTMAVGAGIGSMIISGDYAYISAINGLSNGFVFVVDISDPLNPTVAASTTVGVYPYKIAVNGDFLYVPNGASGSVSIIDISDPGNPVVTSTVSVGTAPISVDFYGNYAFVANSGDTEISIVDISDPANPSVVDAISTTYSPTIIEIEGDYAYVSNNADSALSIYDLSDLSAISEIFTGDLGFTPVDLKVIDNYLYIANVDSNLMPLMDISDPANPSLIKNIDTVYDTYLFAADDQYLYASGNQNDYLAVIGYANFSAGDWRIGTASSRSNLNVQGNIISAGDLRIGTAAAPADLTVNGGISSFNTYSSTSYDYSSEFRSNYVFYDDGIGSDVNVGVYGYATSTQSLMEDYNSIGVYGRGKMAGVVGSGYLYGGGFTGFLGVLGASLMDSGSGGSFSTQGSNAKTINASIEGGNSIGLYISNNSGSAQTGIELNSSEWAYGLKIANTSSTGYSIYSDGGFNYFNGDVGIGIAIPSVALEVAGAISSTDIYVSGNASFATSTFTNITVNGTSTFRNILPMAPASWNIGSESNMWKNIYTQSQQFISYNTSTARALTIGGLYYENAVYASSTIVSHAGTPNLTGEELAYNFYKQDSAPDILGMVSNLKLTAGAIGIPSGQISYSANLYVGGALSGANENYAIWSDSGWNRFDGTTTLAVDGGNVGIGTTTPGYKLTVTGDSYFDGNVTTTGSLVAGSFAVDDFTFANATGTNSLNIAAGGSYRYNGVNLIIASTTLNNYFLGSSTGNLTMTGTNNSAFGAEALRDNVSGSDNSAFGNGALKLNVSGEYNTAVGSGALTGSYGSDNTAVGAWALLYNLNGSYNVGIGRNALRFSSSSNRNTAVGYGAGEGWGTGYYSNSNNSLFGYMAGSDLSTGGNNLLFGYQAGDSLTSGSNNIIIGYDVDATATQSNFLNIGDSIYGDLSTDNIGIGTSTIPAGLTLQSNNGLFVYGTLNSGWTGYKDAVTGMQFVPESASFRAGRSSAGTSWDNLGDYSAGFGLDNLASANYTFVAGFGNVVTGNYASGFGESNEVSGIASFGAGYSTRVSGDYAVGFGWTNYADGDYSFVAGRSNNVQTDYSAAFGYNVTIDDTRSFVVGLTGSAISSDYADQFKVGADYITLMSGAVTVNTTTPQSGYELTVAGDTYIEEDLTVRGNVGIGTSTPQYRMEMVSYDGYQDSTFVVSNFSTDTATSSAAANIGVSNGSSLYDSLTISVFGENFNTNTPGFYQADYGALSARPNLAGLNIGAMSSTGMIKFYTAGQDEANARMAINSSGYVGIGTTTPLMKLHIEGGGLNDSRINIRSASSAPATLSVMADSDYDTADDNRLLFGKWGDDVWNQRQGFISNIGTSSLNFYQMPNPALYNPAGDNSGLVALSINSNKKIGIGTTTPAAKLHIYEATSNASYVLLGASTSTSGGGAYVFKVTADGTVYGDKAYATGADYAEYFYTRDTDLTSGEAVCVDVTKNNAVVRCTRAGDDNIMGIVSTRPAIVGNSKAGYENNPSYKIVAMLGQIPAKASAENGEIRPGDYLTAASIPGYVMKAGAGDATVGVALESLTSGDGLINVMISRRNKSLTVEQIEDAVTQRIADMELEDEVNIMLADTIKSYDFTDDIAAYLNPYIASVDAKLALLTDTLNLKVGELASTTLGADINLSNQLLAANNLISLLSEQASTAADNLSVVSAKTEEINTKLQDTDARLATLEFFTSSSIADLQTAIINLSLQPATSSTHFAETFNSLKVEGDSQFNGTIKVVGDAEFRGKVIVRGQIAFGGDSVGQAKLLGNATSSATTTVHIAFEQIYENLPIITATPIDYDGKWKLSRVSTTGFDIIVDPLPDQDIIFNWHAFSSLPETKLIVSDGSSELINATVTGSMVEELPLEEPAIEEAPAEEIFPEEPVVEPMVEEIPVVEPLPEPEIVTEPEETVVPELLLPAEPEPVPAETVSAPVETPPADDSVSVAE